MSPDYADSQRDAVIVFTRLPLPGMTKTRLMTHLAPEECAELQSCFLKDIGAVLADVPATIFVNHTPANGPTTLDALHGVMDSFPGHTLFFPQPDELGFGERLTHAFRHVFELGFERIVLLGSDAFEMRADYIEEAFEALEAHELVFAPSPDGGYGIVGMREFVPEVFELDAFSDESVLERTLSVANETGSTVTLISTIPDIDEYDDIEDCLADAGCVPESAMTQTHAYLSRVASAIARVSP